jgi:outer membrane biogenesis lipoprotein LolB
MKHYLHIIVSVWIMLFLSACGSSSTKHSPKVEEDNTSISYDNQITENDINTSDLKSYKIEGVAQKGELLDGQVPLYKVDSHGNKA